MAPGVVIDDATAADRPTLIRFMAALQEFERALEPNRLPGADCAEDHLRALLAWVDESGGGVLVARENGPPRGKAPEGANVREREAGAALGFILFGIEEEFGRYVLPENQRVGKLSDLYVVEAARGRGVGRALVAAAERRLLEAGVRRVEVSAVIGNRAARAAYEALGYAPSLVTLARALPTGPDR